MTLDDSQLDPFVQSVAAAIDGARLLEPQSAVVVGVSGGADSVALLAVLAELSLQVARGYRLIVAHLNHGLRREAHSEEQFVIDLAGRWNLACEVRRCDVAAEARRRRQGVEQVARRLRYDFLLDVARACGASRVAVGHQADDQVETVLFHLLRGCHLRGLAGMAAVRPLESDIVLVRPLLAIRRSEVEAYCTRTGLAWCQDASNIDTVFRRNFIRHELLPLLRRRVNPQVDQALLGIAATAAAAERYLQRMGELALGRMRVKAGDPQAAACALDLSALRAEAPLVRRYAVRLALERAGVPMQAVTAEHLHRLAAMADEEGPAAVDLPRGWTARAEGGNVVLLRPSIMSRPPPATDAWAEVLLACPGRTVLPDGRTVVCDLHPLDRLAFGVHCRSGRHDVEWLDAGTVQGPLSCRPRRIGDAFRPLGCGGRRKVGKLLTDLKLPPAVRRCVLCVHDRTGIVAVLPVRIDERVKITGTTRQVLRIAVLDAGGPRG